MQINQSMNEVVEKVRGQWDVARAQGGAIASEIEKLIPREQFTELERRARESIDGFEKKARETLDGFEKRARETAAEVLTRVQTELEVATKQDVTKLAERVEELGRTVERMAQERAAAAQKKAGGKATP